MKRVMIAVVGLSPQVVTEAVYGLAFEGKHVDEIHLLTTRSGRDEIMKHLLSPGDGKLAALCREYDIRLPDCGPHTLHVIRDEAGVELDDIAGQDDNERFLSMCLDLAWRHTGREDCAVIFLVAGGRKTMTSCLTLAAQLYGRPCDRILHVLVTPEFESCRDFWYPPKKSVPLTLRDPNGIPYTRETRYAEVTLVPVPFVSLRDRLDPALYERPRPPAELIAALVRDEEKFLSIDPAAGRLAYGGQECDLAPAQLALYAWFAARKKDCGRKRDTCRDCDQCYVDVQGLLDDTARISAIYQDIPGSRLVEEMSDSGIAALNKENFRSYRAKINARINDAFGPAAARLLGISSTGRNPVRYGIRLDRKRIRLVI